MNNSTDIRVLKLMKNYEKTGHYDIDELFNLHNLIYSAKEYNKKCGKCVKRTLKNVQRYYARIK